MPDFPIFLINLDGSDARLTAATEALAAQGAAFTRIAGHDGRMQPPEDVPEYNSDATRRYLGRDLNGGEVGCFLSHRKAVQAFHDSGAPYGLVLEDDMHPRSGAIALTQTLIDWQQTREAQDWQVANLGAQRMKIISAVGDVSAGTDTATVLRGHYFPMLGTALLWTRDGAAAFLKNSLPIDCPFDVYTRRWLTAIDMGLTVSPALFTTTGATSDIDTSHKAKRRSYGERTRLYHLRRLRRMAVDRLWALFYKTRHLLR